MNRGGKHYAAFAATHSDVPWRFAYEKMRYPMATSLSITLRVVKLLHSS